MKDQVKVVAEAVRSEREASLFYRMLAGLVEDREVRQKLEELAADEASHAQTLDNLHVALTGKSVSSGEMAEREGGADFFDFTAKSLEDVLLFAIANESVAHDLYEAQADRSDEPSAERMFRILAETEEGHAAFLKLQLQRLKKA